MVMKRTNREKCNQVSSDAIRESSLFCFSPCSCYTSDVPDWSDRFVARDAQSPVCRCTRHVCLLCSRLIPVCFLVVPC